MFSNSTIFIGIGMGEEFSYIVLLNAVVIRQNPTSLSGGYAKGVAKLEGTVPLRLIQCVDNAWSPER